jgi:hypothetical protein
MSADILGAVADFLDGEFKGGQHLVRGRGKLRRGGAWAITPVFELRRLVDPVWSRVWARAELHPVKKASLEEPVPGQRLVYGSPDVCSVGADIDKRVPARTP